MDPWFHCYTCRKFAPTNGQDIGQVCPLCGSSNVRTLSTDEFKKLRESGVVKDVPK